MKWFKHMTNAHADDKLVTIRNRFGMWGVGVYWSLVERVAEQMKGIDPIPVAVFDVSELCSFCGCKRNKLETFLRCLRNQRGINWERSGNIIKIEIKKLLEIKDNYHKDLEETSQTIPSKEVEEEVEPEVEKDITGILAIQDSWNRFASSNGLATILKISDKRKAGIISRLKEPEFNLDKIFEEIAASEFLRGKTGWKVDFDFVFCSANNYLKILEGKYRNATNRQLGQPGSQGYRATFTHGEEQKRKLANLKASLDARRAERDKRSGTD